MIGLPQKINVASTTALVPVGQRYTDPNNGKEYVYVTAGTALTLGDVAVHDQSFSAAPATATLAELNSNIGIGVAMATIAANSYGWLQIYGANAAIHTGLGATYSEKFAVSVTAGRLEKTSAAATGGGGGRLSGIFITTTCYTAGSTVAGFVNYPKCMKVPGAV